MSLYLIDTNMVSYIIKRRSPAARAHLESLQDQEAGISTITAAEIHYGLAKLEMKGEGKEKRKAVQLLFSSLTIHPWDQATAEVYGRLRARQEATGKSLGPYDKQIAAHALALGAILVSHDAAFDSVADLAGREDWATDIKTSPKEGD